MNFEINLPAIYIANAMGLILCISLMSGSALTTVVSKKERRCLRAILICLIISSVADPIIFTLDGKPGILPYLCVYFGNLWLFLSNMLVGPAWAALVSYHINGEAKKIQRRIGFILSIVGIAILILNLFIPLVFSVDSSNTYSRGPLFWLYSGLAYIFICEGIIVYLWAKYKAGILKDFPVIQFIIPAVVGIAIQSFVYGVSTIWPFISISVASMINTFQKETMFRDTLTGLYNRTYFESIKSRVHSSKDDFSAIMLDMNGFKAINDRFGHSEGDKALKRMGIILSIAVGSNGTAVRLSGDEFMVLLNTHDEAIIQYCINTIQDKLKEYNKKSNKDYELSVSIGYLQLNLKEETMDNLLRAVDLKMYENKKQFYIDNPQFDRRT